MELLLYVVVCLLLLCACSPCYGVLVGPPPLPAGRTNLTAAPLRVGFYDRTCPGAEAIIQAQVQKRFSLDNTIVPALLRMLFHDSFVRGADASILLDSTPGHEAEKEALPNLTIRGFDLIDEVKEAVEAVCPGVFSCADILVLAVRDSVALAGGPKYEVPTGRLDGLVSSKEEALNLPSPAFPVEQSAESFRQKGLDLEDMVVLLGAHTVGVALCGFFNDRLFNFHGTGTSDPTMNPELATRLSTVCPNPFFTESNADPSINLDQATPAVFDAAYYTQILEGNGILQIDQEITTDPSTVGLVRSFTSAAAFFPAFVRSVVKMGNIDVITGDNNANGEIRRKCNVVNSGATTQPPVPASKPSAAAKPAPSGQPATDKPAPRGQVSKPSSPSRSSAIGQRSAHASHRSGEPPSAPSPQPVGHVTKTESPVARGPAASAATPRTPFGGVSDSPLSPA